MSSRAHTKHEVPFFSSRMSDQSESEEWRFEVRLMGVGRKQPRPIDDLCSVSSDSSDTSDATSARWYETLRHTWSLVTVDPSACVVRPRNNAPSIGECEAFRWRPEDRKRKSLLPTVGK